MSAPAAADDGVIEMGAVGAAAAGADAAAINYDVEAGTAGVTTTNAVIASLPPEPEPSKGLLKPIPETTPVERIAGICAIAAIVTALIAMILEHSLIVILGGILSSLIGGYSYVQQTQLTDIRTLKETKQALQEEVTRLEQSNERLGTSLDEMTETVSKLDEVEQALAILTSAQGQSVEAFREQVLESKGLLKSMESNHKATVLQNLLTVIFRSDKDRDNHISSTEVDGLLQSIQNTTGSSVTVHEDRFRAAVTDKPVNAVVDVVENLLRDDVPAEERIFDIIAAPE